MSVETEAVQSAPELAKKVKGSSSTFSRVAKYTAVRVVTLFLTVVVGVFLTILIANMGGYVDKIRRGEIQESVALSINSNPALRNMDAAARATYMDQQIKIQEHRFGLDQPLAVRDVTFLKDALVLNLGQAQNMVSASGSKQVRLILLERLPATLLLLGVSNVFLFFLELFVALYLSRRYGSFLDKMMITMAPLSSAPYWFYGIFLILIFAALLHWLPFGGMVDAPPPTNPILYALSVLKHLVLPTIAILISNLFLNAYTWRTYFLIYSSEDYVEMAKAKGLTSREIENRYILRPTLPTIITTFALTVITLWTGAPIFETVFNWPGLGMALYQAVLFFDTPVIVGQVVVFAYMLALTVFLLDFIYAMVDPRVKIGGGESKT